jgi:signal transduction histidine kinase
MTGSPRRRWRRWPIRRKLAVAGALAGLASLALAAALVALAERREYLNEAAKELGAAAEMTATNCAAPVVFYDPISAQRTLDALRAEKRVAAAAVFVFDGSLLAIYRREGVSNQLTPHLTGQVQTARRHGTMQLERPIFVDGEKAGAVVVISDLPDYLAQVGGPATVVALIMSAAAVISIVFNFYFQRIILRPVTDLSNAARSVSEERNYSVRVPTRSEDELGALAETFNRMLEQIEHHDRDLEEQVSARTAELVAANAELTAARDRADEAARLKSEFLANISHEIRTPMNVILGMTEITLDSPLMPLQRRYLSLVYRSARSLLKMISDILDFSKAEAGRLDISPVEFGLAPMLAEAVAGLAPRAHSKGLDLDLKLAPDLPGTVVGDPARLEQVMVNLIGNALKFTETGSVEVRATSHPSTDDAIDLEVAVRDTGIGISPAQQQYIFEAFRQVDGSATRHFGGIGLGLTISHTLVGMMGGRMWVESEPGKGSTFHFTVPLRPTQTAPAPAPPGQDSSRPQLTGASPLRSSAGPLHPGTAEN